MGVSRKASRGGHYMDVMKDEGWQSRQVNAEIAYSKTPEGRMRELMRLMQDNVNETYLLKKQKKRFWFRRRNPEEQEKENARLDKIARLEKELEDYKDKYIEAREEQRIINSKKPPKPPPYIYRYGGSRKKSRKSKGSKKRSTRRK